MKLTLKQRHELAENESKDIVGRIWKWVLIGVGLGAALAFWMMKALEVLGKRSELRLLAGARHYQASNP
ncbi:MAG: hypothetical protein HLX50_19240 [Alteromonadaceae bacterium]|nr:hypothetical protein [Alteromonadaceae bacterium]